ncbi:MAG: hypothetical protein IKM03_02335 [Alistipes sp.]|nr:hypothetical protein [Alistipes sp.]
MKKLFLLQSFCLALIFSACTNDNTEQTPTVVATPTNIKAYDGCGRVRILWSQNSDDAIAKTMIYWNDRNGSATHTPKQTSQQGIVRDSIDIKEILEGVYTFEIVNYDAKNNPSEAKTIQAQVYGEDYIAELATRPIEELVFNKFRSTATINWQEGWNQGLGTEVQYADEDASVWVKNSDSTTEISPAEVGAELTIRTLYCPTNCLDTMRSAPVKRKVEAAPVVLFEPSEAKGYDGYKRVKLMWSQDVESDLHKTSIIWGLTEDQACEKIFNREAESGLQRDSIYIDLPEGEYTFTLTNMDAEGNATEPIEVKAKAYGEEYVAELETRPVAEIEYKATISRATLTFDTWDKGLDTELRYTRTNGQEVVSILANDNNTAVCNNIDKGTAIEIRSRYCPENCIDTMRSAVVTKYTPKTILAKPSEAKGYDGYKRVKLMWSQDVATDLHKTTISWGSAEEQRCEKVFNREAEGSLQRDSIYIDLPEGEYTFTLTNMDAEGNAAEPVEVKAKAYGEEYVAKLETRPVTNFTYQESISRANLTFASWNKGLDTEVRYTRTNGQEVVAIIANSNNTTSCNNIGGGSAIEIRSRFCPENCIDTMRSALITKVTPQSISVSMKVMQLNVKNGMIGFLYGMWDSRKAGIVNFLKSEAPDFIGLQELGYGSGNSDYYTYILSGMGSNYAGVKYERNTAAEGNAILYRKDKFDLIKEGRFWLCNTPDSPAKHSVTIGSTTYTANYERIAVWGIFRDKTTGKEFYVTTTHLDNSNTADDKSSDWRVYPVLWEQGQILVNNTNANANYGSSDAAGRRPIILTGDMNCNYNEEPMKNIVNNGYKDTWDIAQSKSCPDASCPRSTMSEAKSSAAQKPYSCFDHIFVGGGVIPTVMKHTIHPPKFEGTHLSDHNAVSVEIKYTFSE